MGLVDRPGGHKTHDAQVPLVGGLGIYAALLVVLGATVYFEVEGHTLYSALLAGASLLFVVGLIDDVHNLGVRVRFIAQGTAASITALWGGVMLNDFGALVTGDLFALGLFALPVTIFAAAGVINALNMADGIDGLSGSLSLVSLLLLAVIAYLGHAAVYLPVILTMIGAVLGFLVFNMRCCGRKRAATFMGDAGSTMLGFLFACLFVGLSQGEARAMSPVTALWLFAVPLYDTTATMVRRMWLGKSPFRADRSHLHHLLLKAGCTVPQGVVVMALLQLLLGGIGLVGWYQAVPERFMFAGFIGLFLGYLLLVIRPWRFVPHVRRVHRAMDAPITGVTGIFVDGLPLDAPERRLAALFGEGIAAYSYGIYRREGGDARRDVLYAVIETADEHIARRLIRLGRRPGDGIVVRQLIPRNAEHDRRQASRSTGDDRRRVDRRSTNAVLVARHDARTQSGGYTAAAMSEDRGGLGTADLLGPRDSH